MKTRKLNNKQRGGNPFMNAFNQARQAVKNNTAEQFGKIQRISNKAVELRKTIDSEMDISIDKKISNEKLKLDKLIKVEKNIREQKKKSMKKFDEKIIYIIKI